MYWADEMVLKSGNGQAANRRLPRYIMLASSFHISPLIDILMFNIKYLQGLHMLEKCLNIQGCLEKSLKIKFALKST